MTHSNVLTEDRIREIAAIFYSCNQYDNPAALRDDLLSVCKENNTNPQPGDWFEAMTVTSRIAQRIWDDQGDIWAETDAERFDRLGREHEHLRQLYIARDGKIDGLKEYPDLDEIALEQFYILSGGKDTLTLSEDWIKANADEVVDLSQ